MKKLLFFILTLSFSFANSQITEDYMESSLVKLNQNVPEFSFKTADGKSVNLSDYKGKVILINFFATWCGPCMKEMPYLQSDIWNNLKDNPNFILLSFGRDHSQAEVSKFIASKKFTFPIYPDAGKTIFSLFATKYIPRNYLIDANGTVVYASTGFTMEEFQQLKTKINTLLNK